MRANSTVDILSEASSNEPPVGSPDAGTRGRFITRLYLTLLGAMLWIAILDTALIATGSGLHLFMTIASSSRGVLLLLGITILALAEAAVRYVRSIPMLTGIALLYVSFCALVLVPVLGVVGLLVGRDLVGAASTFAVFGVAFLTVVMARRRAFTFVGALVVWIYVGIFLSIVLGVIFNVSPESMGTALVSFLIGCVLLYQTSEMLERYSGDRHIAAALDILLGMSIFWIFVRRLLRPVTPWSS